MKKFILFAAILVFLMVLFIIPKSFAYNIEFALPGTQVGQNIQGPVEYINVVFTFALSIVGILAMASIIIGGVRYVASAGNASVQSDAKNQIFMAIVGLILLIASTLLLALINPDFVNLSFSVTPAPAGPTAQPPSLAGPGSGNSTQSFNAECNNNSDCMTALSCIRTNATTERCLFTTFPRREGEICYETNQCNEGFLCIPISPNSPQKTCRKPPQQENLQEGQTCIITGGGDPCDQSRSLSCQPTNEEIAPNIVRYRCQRT